VNARRILLVGEAVTLAHVVRLLSIGKALHSSGYEVILACDPRYDRAVGVVPFRRIAIESMPPSEFQSAISTGGPIFTEPRLAGYVDAELSLLREERPDVVISDFRISLAISARVAGVPLVTLTNAYWSPFALLRHVVPEIAVARIAGAWLGQVLFALFRRVGYGLHVVPVNKVRRRFGMAPLPSDFRYALVDGDLTCYSDSPEVIATAPLPASHQFVGPIPWSPAVSVPSWWSEMLSVRAGRKLVYLTLGSSGPGHLLDKVLSALTSVDAMVLVATAGRAPVPKRTARLFGAEYLPGDAAAKIADLVVSNGGSPTTYQSLSEGVPVVGVATNMDQFLNMAAVEDCGLGWLVRSGGLDSTAFCGIVSRALDDAGTLQRTRQLADSLRAMNWAESMRQAVETVVR
jgi:UDP:flavonoid glycosyltransferase YjiC (YdhE family)